MITLVGKSNNEFVNPSLKKLDEKFSEKYSNSEKAQILICLADGLFRKATSSYIDRTSVEVLEFIVEKAFESIDKFESSEEEASIYHFYLPTDKKISGFITILKDRPFIVDTIKEYFIANNSIVQTLLHPIFSLKDGSKISICYTQTEIPHGLKIDNLVIELGERLRQLKATTNDFSSITEYLNEIKVLIENKNKNLEEELKDLLKWLSDGASIFLGVGVWDIPTRLISKEYGILREKNSKFTSEIAPYLLKDLDSLIISKRGFICSKLPIKSPVHRPNYIDLITLRINEETALSIPSLFTSKTLSQPASTIPVIKNKLSDVLLEEGLIPNSYDYKELISIADTLPKSDFLQYSDDEIKLYFKEINKTQLKGNASLIYMIDPAKRFHSFTSIITKERYSSELVNSIEDIILKNLNSSKKRNSIESFSMLGDYPIVLIRSILPYSENTKLKLNLSEIEQEIEDLSCSWDEKLRDLLSEEFDDDNAIKLFSYYSNALSDAYKATHSPEECVCDIQMLERLSVTFPLELSLEEHPSFDDNKTYRLRIYKRGESLTLSGIVPFLENAGFEIISEIVTSVATEGSVWAAIYDLFVTPKLVSELESINTSQILLPSLKKILQREVDNDYLNHLLITPGITARNISILRATVQYLIQIGQAPSPRGTMDALVKNPSIAELFITYFYSKFEPSNGEKGKASEGRIENLKKIDEKIKEQLKQVPQISHDRSLRSIWNVLHSVVRTNFFTLPEKSRICLKIDCSKVAQLPEPRPFMEIFVSSPEFQGVHLRGAKVSRGGLRWSSRKDDFRTEVLGLMKTQMVKNSIIVPAGAKGGFVLKEEPEDRSTLFSAVETNYKDFIRSLLDVTDNRINNSIITPDNIIYYDEEDSYLVVAADRGTATFSDIANKIASDEFNFWLGDAFASGGSAGYDHKALGITAKGAWECALRHFKEIGIDPLNQEFTVIGIGDMSGDVFGNGLLRSDRAKLIAAFDHRHIFIDPDPDPSRSFEERKRLFNMDRSSWDDYDRSVLSHGGLIVSRKQKEITLSPEAKMALDTEKEELSANELIQLILKAPVDLFWNGGIGTYVKASFETNLDASDKDNDELRVNARELRAKIVAEGGNLGFTQRGRIEYTKIGGYINTDAVDNSGGVDTSDLEVNIKLVFQNALIKNEISIEERNSILKECENEVCEKVLSRNRSQSLLLSQAARRSRKNLKFYQEMLTSLEKNGRISIQGEFLPDEETFEKRRLGKAGLSRPELAILVAYTKMLTFESILNSDLPEDQFMNSFLISYFPKTIREKYSKWINNHTLKREIIATQAANILVERMGTTFIYRLSAELGSSPIAIIKSYLIADSIFSGPELFKSLSVLDTATNNRFYINALLRSQRALESISRWFLSEEKITNVELNNLISQYKDPFQKLLNKTEEILTPSEQNQYQENVHELLMHAIPKDLAKSISAVKYAPIYLDIINVSKKVKVELLDIAKLYGHLATELHIGQIIETTNSIVSDNKWDNLATKTLSTQFRRSVANICARAIRENSNPDLNSATEYFQKRRDLLNNYKESLAQITKEDANVSSLYILSNLLMILSE